MSNTQSLEQEQGIAEKIANLVAKFPDVFAIPALGFLGRERPNTEAYYPEIDQKILTKLQFILNDLGYFRVSIESTRKNSDSLSDYPYGYHLKYDAHDDQYGYHPKHDAHYDQWERTYFPNVCYALANKVKKLGFDLSFESEKGLVFVKLQPDNYMSVEKPTDPRG